MEGLSTRPNKRLPTRRGIQRLKTGCRTCKARRVKCDEQRPSCRRCTSAGRECMGYGIWGGGGHPDGGPLTQCLALYRPSNTGPVGHLIAEDRRILEWFMLARLQGIFPFPFWEILVPQACYNEPVILSCVLALGCIHKRACISKGSTDSQHAIENLESATLRHYNTAISLLNRSQSDGSRASTRVTLTGCLTFVIIEYLQKRPTQGLLHLQHGLQILQNHRYNNMRQPSNDPVDDWLVEAFERLDIQAKLLFKNTTDNQPYTNIWANNEHPLTLKSLHDARQELDFLISEAYRLQGWAQNAESSANISLLFQALSTQQRLQRDLTSWLQAYRTWRTTPAQPSLWSLHSPQEQVARRLLLVYHTMASIIAATALYPGDESVFDHHDLQFGSIIASSKEIVQIYNPATPRDPASHAHCTQHFTFTSDLGLIPVLYYTALKCRDPQMRRDALSMLATKTRQEGIWEGPTVALIAAEVIRLEETPYLEHGEICDEGSANGHILSGSPSQLLRISDVIITLPDGPGTDLVLVCKRKLGNSAWGVVERRHNGVHWY